MSAWLTAVCIALLAVVAAPAAARTPAGCAAKPGTPGSAAMLQYCAEGARSAGSTGGAASSVTPSTSTVPPARTHHRAADAKPSKTEIPVVGYPSTGGINFMLIGVCLVALAVAVAFGARRWRRSRPQAS